MIIRIGYDIEMSVSAPMALVYLLRVHPSRRADLLAPEDLRISGGLVAQEYDDSFGNRCGRLVVPAGMATLRLTNEALIRDSGRLDETNGNARQHDPAELPVAALQFLLPSRYCEVDSELLGFAWERFGATPPGAARVQAICDFVHRHLRFDYQTGGRRAPRSMPIASARACAAISRTWRSPCAAA